MQVERVKTLIEAFQSKRVAVIGDLMLDRYIWGSASRISQEAPVPVVVVSRKSAAPGGAANVLRNLASLGAQALAFGVMGDDDSARELTALLEGHQVGMEGIIYDANRITTEKTRIVSDHQQVVRVDTERIEPIDDTLVKTLIGNLQRAIDEGGLDGIIIEDYAKGTINQSVLREVVALGKAHGIPVALDPHPGNRATAAGITVMSPNRSEAFALTGVYPESPVLPIENDAALMEVVKRLQSTWSAEYLLITLGGEGMALFQLGQTPHHIPTQAREVFDVSGAGDTVIALFVLSLISGASPDEAAAISNHAAGVVVAKVGTAIVTAEELLRAFALDDEAAQA